MSRALTLVFFAAVLFAALAFHLRNDEPVILDYYLGAVELPFSAWLFLSFLAGAVGGILACVPALLGRKFRGARSGRKTRVPQRDTNTGTAVTNEPRT